MMRSRQPGAVLGDVRRLFTAGSVTGLGEAQLLEQFLTRGDSEAFEAILRRHGPMVLGVCRRLLSDPHDVEDAFQATFLVLVKKARSIRDRDVLGTWLYRVAHRIAVRARMEARCQRERERGWVGEEAGSLAATPDDLGELRAVIDEEVGRLTERYRIPFVLCDLEGRTYEQAAAQLRCPIGTVKSRLSRARGELRARLIRRGFAPSAGLLAAMLAPGDASAMRSDLVEITIAAAIKLAAGRAIAAGTVSAAIVAMMEGTLRSMSMGTLKFAVIVLTATALIATGPGVSAPQPPKASLTGPAFAPRTKAGADDGKKPPARTAPEGPRAGNASTSSRSVTSLAQARYDAARKSLREMQELHRLGQAAIEHVHAKALRVLESRREMGNSKEDEVAALRDYLEAMKGAEERTKSFMSQGDKSTEYGDAEYYRLEAEFWLERAKSGKSITPTGEVPGGDRPGTDPRSRALLARLEEPISMEFADSTPLEDVLKYIQQATARPNDNGVLIYVDPVGLEMVDKSMDTPITINVSGVPLRRTLKLIADQLGMGYGIKDGMVMLTAADMRRRNWRELLVMEDSFPESSPLAIEVERAERGELTTAEVEQLSGRLKAIEEVSKRYQSIRTSRFPRPLGPASPSHTGRPSGGGGAIMKPINPVSPSN